MSKEKYSKDIARAVFPWVQGWPHENLIAAKAVAFKEALNPEFRQYARQVVDNAQYLAKKLQDYWFKIVSAKILLKIEFKKYFRWSLLFYR